MKATTKNISRLLLIASILFVSNPIFAEISGIVKGRVIDKKKHPIELAIVTLTNVETQKTTNGAMCDRNGNFIVKNIDPAEYILSVKRIGYKRCESIKVKIDSKDPLMLEKAFVLKDSVQRLPVLVVIAKRKPMVKTPEKVLATNKAAKSISDLQVFSYVSKGYNIVLNNGIQIYDLTCSVKPVLNFGKNLICN